MIRQGTRTKRPLLEVLEDRLAPATLRIGAWNMANNPDDVTENAHFQAIAQAIGNETVQGTTKRLDILAMSETDTNSYTVVDDLLDSLYGVATYESMATAADAGGDRTGFVYDTNAVTLLEFTTVPGAIQHTLARGKFRPSGTTGTEDFYVYSIHLKSGATSANAASRGAEALLIRQDADALGQGANVIYVGDFNMNSSTETTTNNVPTAWARMYAAGNGQAADVANASGNWANNATYKHLHTHSTSAMQKRFDIMFVSAELQDGAGLDYVPNSFHVFANNNTHTLGGAISTGTGASPSVLSSLQAMSDHLPIVADFQFGGLMLNEIYADPPSTDDAREYVEIRSLSANTALTDVWLIEIDGDSTNPGLVDNAQNLTGLTTGTNGLLLLGQNYTTSTPWGATVPAATTKANLLNGTIENGAVTFLLVKNFTGTVGGDLDTNNDGIVDGSPWSAILDSVGWTDGTAGDRVYSTAVLSLASGAPHAATRFPSNTTANNTAAWYYGTITGSGTTTTYGSGSANLPVGAVITPGGVNSNGSGARMALSSPAPSSPPQAASSPDLTTVAALLMRDRSDRSTTPASSPSDEVFSEPSYLLIDGLLLAE